MNRPVANRNRGRAAIVTRPLGAILAHMKTLNAIVIVKAGMPNFARAGGAGCSSVCSGGDLVGVELVEVLVGSASMGDCDDGEPENNSRSERA